MYERRVLGNGVLRRHYAAVSISDRLDRWGESLPLKLVGNDIIQDEDVCDSATTRSEQSLPQQMTLGEFESKPTPVISWYPHAGNHPVPLQRVSHSFARIRIEDHPGCRV